MKKLLNTERAGLDFGERTSSIHFSKSDKKYRSKRKKRYSKICNSKLFSYKENIQSRYIFIHLLSQIPVGVSSFISLLGGQSSFAYVLPVHWLVKRSKQVITVRFVIHFAISPTMTHPNQIYKQKFMKNANAKLQAP